MRLICQTDPRRAAVRSARGRNGLDYVEAGDDNAPLLYVYFLGKLPPELALNRPGLEGYLELTGGESITGIKILDVDPQVQADPERDDFLAVTLDRIGDFSAYTLRLVGVDGIDPLYDRAEFRFRVGCPTGLDCAAPCGCPSAPLDEPQIDYLAKDYASLRQLILDRLAVLMPGWTERHVPDLGITLVELLAYIGDYLSYYQDAVATEAYLGTARQRISVRRHARLVDYALHEGCNARAWLQLEVSGDLQLPARSVAFITGLNGPLTAQKDVLSVEELADVPAGSYEYFEPLPADAAQTLNLRAAHNTLRFYTWGRRECCLLQGATRATLLDEWVAAAGTAAPGRALRIAAGDVLIFEEVLGAKTGVAADADPLRRWAVRVTRAQAAEDSLYRVAAPASGADAAAATLPTPLVEIEWGADDALPFPLCLSAIGMAPDCAYLVDVTVVRGNVILVDHGRTQNPEPIGPVPGVTGASCCECEGEPAEVQTQAGRYRPVLAQAPVTFRQPLPAPPAAASKSLTQDPRAATAAVQLSDDAGAAWTLQPDLLASGPDDRDFVAEIDNAGAAHLRFGDGELGRSPLVGSVFTAVYRVGGGSAGNVGAQAISRLVLKNLSLDGVSIGVRNPLPAQGGIDAEPIEEARLFAPKAFRKQIERAIIAADYAEIAERNPALQRAAARLAWSGSWYEADVAIDPLGTETAGAALVKALTSDLYRYRRMGHDLRVQPAKYVPLKLTLQICALPGYDRGHLKAAVLARFAGGRTTGFFGADNLSFGEGVYLSRIIAAVQALPGVECVTVTEFRRLFELPNHEIDNGVLPLASNEIARLDNDASHPERGQLQVVVGGGR